MNFTCASSSTTLGQSGSVRWSLKSPEGRPRFVIVLPSPFKAYRWQKVVRRLRARCTSIRFDAHLLCRPRLPKENIHLFRNDICCLAHRGIVDV